MSKGIDKTSRAMGFSQQSVNRSKKRVRSARSTIRLAGSSQNPTAMKISKKVSVAEKKKLFVKNHKCTYKNCKKDFEYAAGLKAHINSVHLDIRPFQCLVTGCGKRFSNIHNLKSHASVHSEEKKFSCNLCPGVKYKRSYDLQIHRKQKHSLVFKSKLDEALESFVVVVNDGKEQLQCVVCKMIVEPSFILPHQQRGHVKPAASVFAFNKEGNIRQRPYEPTDAYASKVHGLHQVYLKPWVIIEQGREKFKGISTGCTRSGNVVIAAKENYKMIRTKKQAIYVTACSARRFIPEGWVCKWEDALPLDTIPFQGIMAAMQAKFAVRGEIKNGLMLDTFKRCESRNFFSDEDFKDIQGKLRILINRMANGSKEFALIDDEGDDAQDGEDVLATLQPNSTQNENLLQDMVKMKDKLEEEYERNYALEDYIGYINNENMELGETNQNLRSEIEELETSVEELKGLNSHHDEEVKEFREEIEGLKALNSQQDDEVKKIREENERLEAVIGNLCGFD